MKIAPQGRQTLAHPFKGGTCGKKIGIVPEGWQKGNKYTHMAHSYSSCLYHFVFSTCDRQKIIDAEWMNRLWEYMGGIARNEGMTALCVGGSYDHSHILLQAPPAIAPAKAIQIIKGNASQWVNETGLMRARFAWQTGYGVFTIGVSQIAKTRNYIENQMEHHRAKAFEEEYRAFLKKHMIEVNEDYAWG